MWQKRSKIAIAAAGVASAMLAIASCDNGCEQMRESFMRISFVGTTSRTLRTLEINAHGRREGVALSDSTTLQYTFKASKFDNIELELNPNDSLVTFVLISEFQDYGDKFAGNDTVRVCYQANGRFLDMECGCTVDYEIKQVTCTHNLLSDVTITDPRVHTESGINLELHY